MLYELLHFAQLEVSKGLFIFAKTDENVEFKS